MTVRRVAGWCVVALVLAASGCSRKVDSATVGFTLEPPAGMKLEREDPGPPPAAFFAEGLTVRSLHTALPSPEATDLKALLATALKQAGVAAPTNVTSSKSGTLPAGPVARYEWADATSRTLAYVVVGKDRALLLTLTAPKPDFRIRENQLERALATLQFR